MQNFENQNEMIQMAITARARDLGIDPETLMELCHMDEKGEYTGSMSPDIFTDIMHYGTPRHSGRYPWGSGDNPFQRNANFLSKVDSMRKAKGPDGKPMFTQKQIAESMGMNTSDLRKRLSLANAENRQYLSDEAKRLREKGMSVSAIGRRLGRNESSVRLLLDEAVNERMGSTAKNATILKERVNEAKFIDIGKGSEHDLGISSTTLTNAVHALEQEGYTVHTIQVPQLSDPKQKTTIKVLAKPGVDKKEVYDNVDSIKRIKDVYSEDGGQTMRPLRQYVSVDPKRVAVRYAEEGGADKDGVIGLRRGVDDISLGKNNYAQVRILIDGTHYAKGMAMYDDNIPPGKDILIYSNKKAGTPLLVKGDENAKQVLKPKKSDDLENPFGATIKADEKLTRAQRHYFDENGVEHQSAINIVKEEGDVGDYQRRLPAQFLSKQTPALAKQQLSMKLDIAKAQFDEIASYTNPTVKAAMLEDFAGRCESDAVHLTAAALPRQASKFILPLTNVRDNECYAPTYRDGEQLALVRFPHASITEIPIVTVNNKNREAQKTIGQALDAIGINSKAAERLSGADFDGDTVLAIPLNNVSIRNKPQFEGLKDFNTKDAYPGYPGMKVMTHHQHGLEMGMVSNLITDMTIKGAKAEEIEMAVRHSMVIVDAEKHKLNYKQSEIDNHIPELKAKYQVGGVSTFLSRSTSPEHLPERKEKPYSRMTDEEKARWKNGEQIWEGTGPGGSVKTKRFTDFMRSRMTKEEKAMWDSGDPEAISQVKKQMLADGRERKRTEVVTAEYEKGAIYDPYSLTSTGHRETAKPIERVYADYAVEMKDLARQARKLAREQVDIPRDPVAAKKYEREVESLKKKIVVAEENSPKERQATILANQNMRLILQNSPEMKENKAALKKERSRQMQLAREMVGAKKKTIGGSNDNPLTDREWEAIQAGAVTKTMLRKIIANSDKTRIKELALPKTQTGISKAKVTRAKAMLRNGYSRAEVCDMLDITEGKLDYALDQ